MSTQLEWLEAQALALTPGERAAFATWLLASLEEDDGVGQAWAAEVDRRITLLESGAAQGLPAQQAIAQVRAEHKWGRYKRWHGAGHRTGARGTAAVTLVVIPEAQAEWSRGARYYCEQAGLELGLALVSEFERVLARSDANPLAGAHFRSNARRLVLRGFPFGVVYQLVGNDVYVIGLAHHRRKPGYSERGRKVVSGKSSS